MRRVRSQLDNLASQPNASHSGHANAQQVPVGNNRQTSEVQRRLEGMGIHPGGHSSPAYGEYPMMPQQYQSMHPYYPDHAPSHPMAQPVPMAPMAAMHVAPPHQGGVELDNIKASLDRLTGKLQGIVQSQTAAAERPVTNTVENADVAKQFDRIVGELSWLRATVTNLAETNPSQHNLDGLHHVIDANYNTLCEQVGRIADSNVDPLSFAQAVESSHSELSQQIEAIQQALAGGSMNSNSPPQDFSSLEARLEEITRAVMALSASGSGNDNNSNDGLERIEARLSDLANTVDTFVADAVTTSADQTSPVISGMLGELQAGLAAIDSRISTIGPASEGILDGMAAQLNRLSEKLDNVGVASTNSDDPTNSTVDGALIGRLDQLVERVEALSSGAVDPTAMVAIESQLDRLGGEIETLRGSLANNGQPTGDDTFANAVLEHLQHITNRVDQLDSAGGGSGSDAVLASLEEQISTIASQLSSVETPTLSLGPIEERLGGIEQQLGASRDIAIEIATQVAEDAVTKTVSALPQTPEGAPTVDTEAINALAEDLRTLNAHTQDVNSNSLQTFDAVRGSLEGIVDRLNKIETQFSGQQMVGQPDQTTPNHEFVDQQQNMYGEDTLPEPLPEVEAPDLSMHEVPEATVEAPLQHDDTPIEPGSGAPDLAALVRQTNQRRRETPTSEEASPGTDFIAAARRAAQAAAAEAESVQSEVAETSKKSGLKNIPGFFRKRKKVLVIAAAAVLMIAVAIPLASRFAGRGDARVSSAPAPVVAIEPTTLTEQSKVNEQKPEIADLEDIDNQSVIPSVHSELVTPAPTVMQESNPVEQPQMANSSDENLPAAAETSENATEFKLNREINVGSDALKQSAMSGDPTALFEIGRRYTDGAGVERDLNEAAKWYEQSAKLGFAPAQYRIGNFYEKGHGLQQDATMAAEWYEKAANAGNVIAMHNLAVLHAEGKLGSEPDMVRAFEWFRKAAEYGVRDSQVNVGIFYTNGVGSAEQNLAEAYKWFAVAAKAGDSDASGKRDVIANAMRPDQLEQARAETELWKPKTPDKNANTVTVPDSWKDIEPKTTAATSEQEMLQKAQVLLTKLGFDPGPADGLMGSKTRNAIMAFQQRSGMPVDGEFTPKLLDALSAVSI